MQSFKTIIRSQSSVIRDGKRITISSADLVPGDVVHFKSGDKVPADCIVFNCHEMKVDGSALTGESESFYRQAKHEGSPAQTDPFDSPHVLFASDVIISGNFSVILGEGFGLVVKTGKNSAVGKINKLANAIKPKTSTLTVEIKRFCKSISLLAIITAFIFFFVALARGR